MASSSSLPSSSSSSARHHHSTFLVMPPTRVLPSRNRSSSSFLEGVILFTGGSMVVLILLWALSSIIYPDYPKHPTFAYANTKSQHPLSNSQSLAHEEPPTPTFYDDPTLGYTIEKPIEDWDEKRAEWLKHHPSYAVGVEDRILLVTGSQSSPCRNHKGDHILLKFFKNKVDYCRLHGYDLFYNTALFHPQMPTFWAKIPLVRSAMIAHPEAEWIWWVDSDAAFTDMEFKLPLHKYKHHNLVVHGWDHLIYQKKSWVGLNAGVFLIRNCQWSMDFMDVWAGMGPFKPEYDEWSKLLKATFRDKIFPQSDDQSALVYLLLRQKHKWGDKIFLENEFYFEGYWMEIVGKLQNVTDKYIEMEQGVKTLRRRHAEKVTEFYGAVREEYLGDAGSGEEGWRRPFITHFTGCQPCNGEHNKMYSEESCWEGMQRVLNFADNQVLRKFGFVHPNLLDPSVIPVPFNYPVQV